jgi:hypothetical protein
VLFILWVTTKKHIFGLLLGLLWLWHHISANRIYGSCWKDFHEDHIVSITEDARHGKITIGWQSEQENFFNIKEISSFASSNEWILVDSIIGSYDSLMGLLGTFDKFEDYPKDYHFVILKDNVFKFLEPNDNYHIYVFSTNVQAVSIATTDMTTKNGFVILSSNGKRLRIYHFWGEI